MSNLLGKMTTGGRMSSNWIEITMYVGVEALTLSHMSSASKTCEANGLGNRAANLAMPKALEMIDMHDA